MSVMTGTTDALQSLQEPNGSVPKTRVQSAFALQSKVRRLIDNDEFRSKKRAAAQKLVDGNPPYSNDKLRERNRADACNANWGTARSYCEQASGIYYDLFSEVPTYFTAYTSHGTPEQRVEWSNQMSSHAHDILNSEPRFDAVIQNSQWQMTLHGCGPLWYEDKDSVIPRWCKCGELVVDENADAEPAYWEFACILFSYKPHELYKFIEESKAASSIGWNVDYTKRVIMNAVPEDQQNGISRDWEYYQEKFKMNSFAAFTDAQVSRVAVCFWKEFDGTITQAIIEQESQATSNTANKDSEGSDGGIEYLFFSQGRYQNWREALHPMYYDRGGGKHYTVTGLGVKMYAAFFYENRLICNMADKAMAPKLIFKPNGQHNKPFSLKPMGDYAEVPAGWDLQQTAFNGVLQDGIAMLNEVRQTASSNLAAYRSGLSREGVGNPITAKEAGIRQQQQYAISGTSIARYYKQLDVFYFETMRRLCNLNTTDPMAKEFQRRCEQDSIPKEALGRVFKVEANRVAGNGSASLRQQSLDKIMSMIERYPENGQEQVVRQWIAAYAGQQSANIFYPTKNAKKMGNEQEVEASLQVAAMKVGVPPVVAPEQDPVVFATTFMGACWQAVGSLQQGGKPEEVLAFVHVAGPATLAHMQRFARDPSRQGIYKTMTAQMKKLTALVDQIQKKFMDMQKQQQQQQAQQGQGQQLPPEVQQKLMIQDAMGKQKIGQSADKHALQMKTRRDKALLDQQAAQARLAADVARTDLTTAANIRATRLKAANEPKRKKGGD